MTTLQTIADCALIITPILLVGGIVFAYTQWKSAQNARMAQILLTITERWESDDLEQGRCKVNACGAKLKSEIEKADANNTADICGLVIVANFFDTLGVLIAEGFLDCKVGYKLFGQAEEHYYQLYRPLLDDASHSKCFGYFLELHRLFRNEEAASTVPKTKRRHKT